MLWPLDVMTLPSSLQIDLILLIIPMVNEAVTFDWSLTFVLKYNSTCMDVCKFPFRGVVKLFYLYITMSLILWESLLLISFAAKIIYGILMCKASED